VVAQTDRNFSVLLSDNHSTKGVEFIDAAVRQLEAAGINVRRIRPPYELGRVEHWNWAHYGAKADWLKPLFAGDWLETDYVAKVRAAIIANPPCRYLYVGYVLHHGDAPPQEGWGVWAGNFRTAAEMERAVLSHGMQFGPPSAAAYEREAFIAIGGFPTTLPICSDSLMFCVMASRFGALGLVEPLCHFNIHGARFSSTLPQQRRAAFRETLTYDFLLGYHAWTENVNFSKWGFARLLFRETRAYLRAR
jgi:hypothetical protein